MTIQTERQLNAVIERHGPMVYRLALARTQTCQDAEDIYQEVFVRLAQRRPEFESEAHLKHWLLRVTVNMSNSLFRRMRRVVSVADVRAGAAEDDYRELRLALKALPERYRVPVLLHYFEGLKIDEIAGVLGRKPSAVKMQLSRARAMLREALTEREEDSYGFQ